MPHPLCSISLKSLYTMTGLPIIRVVSNHVLSVLHNMFTVRCILPDCVTVALTVTISVIDLNIFCYYLLSAHKFQPKIIIYAR
jgi:hypothetical protein